MSDWSGYDESGVGSADPDAQAQALHDMWQKLGDTWLGGLAKSMLAPGRAATGQYDTQPATPGIWTDEDEARSQLNNQAMYDQAGDLANLAVTGGLPSVALHGAEALAANKSTFGSFAGAGKMGHNGGPAIGGNPGGFYSAVGRAVENAPKSTRTAEEWGGWLRNQPGIKADELTSLGLNPDAINPGLRGQKLDKDTLLGHVRTNTPKFDETVLGENGGLSIEYLGQKYPEQFRLLRQQGLEPEISPDGRMLGIHDIDSGEILHPHDLSGPGYDAPPEVARAAQIIHDGFSDMHAESGARTQYEYLSGIPDQRGGNSDPTYRERTMQLQRQPRDEIEPDDLAVRKYQKSWDDAVAKVRAAREAVDPNDASTVEEHRQAKVLLDQIRDRMIDDTWQRKPYWQNRGMQHGADDIEQAADKLADAAAHGAFPDVDRTATIDAARGAMQANRRAPYDYNAPHFGDSGVNKNLLFHVRDTDGMLMPEPGFVVRNSRSGNKSQVFQTAAEAHNYLDSMPDSLRGDLDVVGSTPQDGPKTHHVEEFQSDWLQRARDKGYQLPPEPEPDLNGMLDKLGWKMEEVPNYVPRDTKQIIEDKVTRSMFDGESPHYVRDGGLLHYKDSIADEAVQKGWITPEEAAQWKYARANPGPFKLTYNDTGGSDFYYSRPQLETAIKETYRAQPREGYNKDIPDAPFKGRWQELAMKKAVLDAVAKGKDAVSWWPGEVHNQRYGFEHHYSELRYDPNTQQLTAFPKGGDRGTTLQVKAEELADYVGKERAEKLLQPIGPGADKHLPDEFAAWRQQHNFGEHQSLDDLLDGLTDLAGDEARGHHLNMPPGWYAERLREAEAFAERYARAEQHDAIPQITQEYSNWLTRHRMSRMSMDELQMEMAHHVHNLQREGFNDHPDVQRWNELRDFQRRYEAVDPDRKAQTYNSLKGDDLRVITKNGQGQNGFYNDIMPRTANSLFKKYGAKVERGTVATERGMGPAHVLKITPKLREAVQNEGLPLFQAGVPLPHIMNDGRDDDGK